MKRTGPVNTGLMWNMLQQHAVMFIGISHMLLTFVSGIVSNIRFSSLL
jgi:hypothetical protein